jgi:hypothetical protein
LTPTTTVTLIPPGSTVSVPPTVSRPLGATVIVVVWPDASVPDDSEMVSPPTSADDGEIDQFTADRRAHQHPQVLAFGFAGDVGGRIGHVRHRIKRRRHLRRAGTQPPVALVAGHGI